MRVASLLAGLLAACGAASPHATSATNPSFAATEIAIPRAETTPGSIALAATRDARVLALGPSDAPLDGRWLGRWLLLAADGSVLADAAVEASAPPFVVLDGDTVRVVWPGGGDTALAALDRVVGDTSIAHERASVYFTQPYAALPIAGREDAPRYVLLHRDPVSCFGGGTTAAATVSDPGGGDPRSFVAPGSFAPSLALAPSGDGFVAVFAPGADDAPSGWQRLDASLAPVGIAHPLDAVGCGHAARIGAERVVLACDDAAIVVDDTDHAERVAYPTRAVALALTTVGETAIAVLHTPEALVIVRADRGEAIDRVPTTLAGLALDSAPRGAVSALEDGGFVVGWLEGGAHDAHVRLRRYASAL